MAFIYQIINHFSLEGIIDPKRLYESTYTDNHNGGIEGLFNDEKGNKIIQFIDNLNKGVA